jgi:endo-1,4-beta-mannosidase
MAMRLWSEFDAGVVADDFALISELGMSTVRIFLLWEDFQPEPTKVSQQALGQLQTVCDLAERHRLSSLADSRCKGASR